MQSVDDIYKTYAIRVTGKDLGEAFHHTRLIQLVILYYFLGILSLICSIVPL